ncbi:MAG: LLM class flavin-dependent oxidoreductase [Nitrososphaerales archaeon]
MSGAVAWIGNVVQAAKEAEALGYDSIWMQDRSLTQTRDNYRNHLVCGSVEDIDPNGDPNFFEPLTSMAALSVLTSSIRIGTAVLQLPLYNPILLAKQAANIDALSAGRLNLGVGIGTGISFARQGFDNLHFPFHERGKIFDEYLTAILQLWRSDSPSSFKGKYIQFSNLELFPKPSSLKLFLGSGVAEKGLRRVVEFGNGVILPYRNPAESKASVLRIRNAMQKRGKEPGQIEIAQTIYTSVGRESAEARALLYPTIAARAKGFVGKGMSTDDQTAPSKHVLSADDFFDMSLVGTPQEIVKQVETFQEAGIDHLIMVLIFRGTKVSSLIDTLKTFAREIIPSFH